MSHRISGYMGDRKSPSCVYVGNLPDDIKERELQDLFLKFGRIEYIDIKRGRTTNGTAYAFVEFESVKDAQEAVERRHGYPFAHTSLRVELTGERKQKRREPFVPPSQRRTFRTEHRVIVTHLPDGCRWQHLKDHMRRAGDVGYANVEGGRGIVEYLRGDDLRYAIEKLDATEMVGPFGDASIIKVREDDYYDGGYNREGRDAYARKRYRSRSYDKDYRRRSRSLSCSDRMSVASRNRRSPHTSQRGGKHGDESRRKGEDDYGYERGGGGAANGRYYSRSRSRSRSRSGSRSRSANMSPSGSRSQSRGNRKDYKESSRFKGRRDESYENMKSKRRHRSSSEESNSRFVSQKSDCERDRSSKVGYYSSNRDKSVNRRKSKDTEDIESCSKSNIHYAEGRRVEEINNEYEDGNSNNNDTCSGKHVEERRKSNCRSRSCSFEGSKKMYRSNSSLPEDDPQGDLPKNSTRRSFDDEDIDKKTKT